MSKTYLKFLLIYSLIFIPGKACRLFINFTSASVGFLFYL